MIIKDVDFVDVNGIKLTRDGILGRGLLLVESNLWILTSDNRLDS
jgi:hypothetical protein